MAYTIEPQNVIQALALFKFPGQSPEPITEQIVLRLLCGLQHDVARYYQQLFGGCNVLGAQRFSWFDVGEFGFVVLVWYRNTKLLSQPIEGFDVRQFFVLHQEVNRIATRATFEALVNPSVFTYKEITLRVVVVKWANAGVVYTSFVKFNKVADHGHDVRRVFDFLCGDFVHVD
jgi:hypothetical protein